MRAIREVCGAQHDESRRDRECCRTGQKGFDHRSGLDDFAEVNATGFLDGLANGCLSKRRRAQSIIAGVHVQELDRARQAIVQSRPPLLDAQRDVEIVEPDDERADDPPVREPGRRTDERRPGARPGSRNRDGTASRLRLRESRAARGCRPATTGRGAPAGASANFAAS